MNKVAIVMGSDSDLEIMKEAADVPQFEIGAFQSIIGVGQLGATDGKAGGHLVKGP